MRIGFIGAGKVGFTLGKYFAVNGLDVAGYYSRNYKSAEEAAAFTCSEAFDSITRLAGICDIIFLTVTDGNIREVAESLKRAGISDRIICHCSGALSSEIFSDITGCTGYSVHPFFAINNKYDSYKELTSTLFTIEGPDTHRDCVASLIRQCGNKVIFIQPDMKARYHGAAVFASNLLMGLMETAVDELAACGFSKEDALTAIYPLALNNLKHPRCFLTVLTSLRSNGPVRHLKLQKEKTLTEITEKWRICYMTTVTTLMNMKQKGDKITMLTCYDYSMAKLMDNAGVDTLLVGDSLGMTILGYEDTLSVTMEDMIHHTAAVARGAKNALVIGDMPFMSYQVSVEQAVINAGRLIKEGRAQMVKLEGGASVCPQIEAIVKASIPVCAHLGLTPQSINMFGGFKVQGKTEEAAKKIIDDARKIEAAGASMVVLEGIPTKLAQIITKELTIPTIGIGAGQFCDGQVLVYQDMLGMFSDFKPKFVKVFANTGEFMTNAFNDYIKEVKDGSFPAEENSYSVDNGIFDFINE